MWALPFLQSGRDWGIIGGNPKTARRSCFMRDGFIKVAAATPQIRVADCRYNAEQIFTLMREGDKEGG